MLAPSDNVDNLFGEHWLASYEPDRVAWSGLILTCVCLLVLEIQRRRTRRARVFFAVNGFALAAFLVLVLPGNFSLDVVPGINLLNAKRYAWPTFHLTLLCYTGLALGASTLAYVRETAEACPHCGRQSCELATTHPRRRRAGVVVTIVAALAPCGYAVNRLLWAAGIPVGTTKDFLEQINAANGGDNTIILELILASMAMSGGLLTFGLVRPWSRTWPRPWPRIGGSPVPHALPVTAGLLAGVGLTGLGTSLWPPLVRFARGETVMFGDTAVPTTWVSHIPGLSLAVWGPLVLVATAAFHLRTRSSCVHCGRG